MFGWSHADFSEASRTVDRNSKKIQELRTYYQDINTFVIDEVNAMSAAEFSFLHETLSAIKNENGKKGADGHVLPFGGAQMVFMGDASQLSPVSGPAIYGKKGDSFVKGRRMHASRSVQGQDMYRRYLVPNCVFLQKGQRNRGVFGEICDRLRQGKQNEEDLRKLMFQRKRFPDLVADYGIHYDNETCSFYNWRQLWSDCQAGETKKRLYLCKASYHSTGENQLVVDGLVALPSKLYNYAPDILCVAEGCEVRLIKNLNVSAGLVNSASGRVLKVIYNNVDVKDLLEGKNPPPYCIIVDFPEFRGFVDDKNPSGERIRPFVQHPTWVPIYRQQFTIAAKDLPSWIRRKQMPKDCYRVQFPLDLSSHITAHRAQGQTLRNCTVAVDLGLENPDARMPNDIASVIYVALTRATDLKYVFMGDIFPELWAKIGQGEEDAHRREVEETLKKSARDFASKNGKLTEMDAELSWNCDNSNNEHEWQLLQDEQLPPPSGKAVLQVHELTEADFEVRIADYVFPLCLKPVILERHIGLDQGIKNFAIVAVEKKMDSNPIIVTAENYNLHLPNGCKANDVLIALCRDTNLLKLMKQDALEDDMERVDRVIVHLEQIALANRNSKAFGIELGWKIIC